MPKTMQAKNLKLWECRERGCGEIVAASEWRVANARACPKCRSVTPGWIEVGDVSERDALMVKEYGMDTDDHSGDANDMIEHPPHYTFGKIECWDAIADWQLDYFEGCAVKYIVRARRKGTELQDLKKARAFLGRKIRLLEEANCPESRLSETPIENRLAAIAFAEAHRKAQGTAKNRPSAAQD